jgi:hypothetical protein
VLWFSVWETTAVLVESDFGGLFGHPQHPKRKLPATTNASEVFTNKDVLRIFV